MRIALKFLGLAAAVCSWQTAYADANSTAAAKAASWLATQQNLSDGSWGTTDDVKYVQTSEAVFALWQNGRYPPASYYGGIAWLDNHTSSNIDFASRRILTIGQDNANLSSDLALIGTTQNTTGPGNSGWGLSGTFQGSPLETSLSLQALSSTSQSYVSATNMQAAVKYLLSTQLPVSGNDPGWPVGQEIISDPVTTAQAILVLLQQDAAAASACAQSACTTATTNGLTALNAKVPAKTTTPVPQMALAALANLAQNKTSAQGIALINQLVSLQSSDGSWAEDAYATALTLRALAFYVGNSPALPKSTRFSFSPNNAAVSVPDSNLRRAINRQLGQSGLDTIYQQQMLQLTTLNLLGSPTLTLQGLQFATNLLAAILPDGSVVSYNQLIALIGSSTTSPPLNNPSPSTGPQVAINPAALAAILTLLQSDDQ